MAPKPGSYPSREPERGESNLPPAQLIRLHRHSLTNVLIVGGTAARRDQVARAFHRESPLRAGAFVSVDCEREEDRLQAALQEWTGAARAREDPGMNPFRAAEQGTLYLDSVEHLPPEAQRLLLALARRLLGDPVGAPEGPCAGRLVVGNPRGLADAVAEGTFLASLYDAIDKVRVELELPAPGKTA